MRRITPTLWFNGNAEEAMNFYLSVFRDSEELAAARYNEAGPMPAGTVLTVQFRLNDLEFLGINAGPEFQFTEAVSFMIDCQDQDEVDYYWNALTADGGEEGQCGWCKDRFGLSWQVVPRRLGELMQDPDPARSGRATQAMMQMNKIDVAALEAAANAEG